MHCYFDTTTSTTKHFNINFFPFSAMTNQIGLHKEVGIFVIVVLNLCMMILSIWTDDGYAILDVAVDLCLSGIALCNLMFAVHSGIILRAGLMKKINIV